jgi:ribosomal protein S14
MHYSHSKKKYKLVKSLVRRSSYYNCENKIKLYNFIFKNNIINKRSRIWAQEFMLEHQSIINNYIIQNLCIKSGKKRSVLQFFQLYRLELRDCFTRLDISGTYHLY